MKNSLKTIERKMYRKEKFQKRKNAIFVYCSLVAFPQYKWRPLPIFPLIELKWCSCNLNTTVLLQSAQFEHEKDDYRHKFTDGKEKEENQKKSGERKTIFICKWN